MHATKAATGSTVLVIACSMSPNMLALQVHVHAAAAAPALATTASEEAAAGARVHTSARLSCLGTPNKPGSLAFELDQSNDCCLVLVEALQATANQSRS